MYMLEIKTNQVDFLDPKVHTHILINKQYTENVQLKLFFSLNCVWCC